PELVRRAYAVATSGRAGAVVLDIPEDVCHARVEYADTDFWTDPSSHQVPARRVRPDHEALDRAAALLNSARRPVALVGGGIHLSGAHQQLEAFVAAHVVPVAHTMSGKGAIKCTDPMSVGLF